MDILSPVAAVVIALFESLYQEEFACFDDFAPPLSDSWVMESDLRYNLLDTRRHIRHLDSVQGIDMDRQTAWMLVRSPSSGPGALVMCHLMSGRILF